MRQHAKKRSTLERMKFMAKLSKRLFIPDSIFISRVASRKTHPIGDFK